MGYYRQFFEDEGMKDNFEKALKFTLDPSIEGGFSNRLNDRGGPTNKGITLKTLQNYYKDWNYGDFDNDGDCDIDDIRLLDTIEEAMPIYKRWFWNVIKGDDLPSGIDYVIFDSAVNHGPYNAVIFLQRAINRMKADIDEDGAIGPQTLKAIKKINGQTLLIDILRERDIFYHKIIANDPSQEENFKGWLNRLAKVAINVRTFL